MSPHVTFALLLDIHPKFYNPSQNTQQIDPLKSWKDQKREDSLSWASQNYKELSKQKIANPIILFLSDLTLRPIKDIKIESHLVHDLNLDDIDLWEIHHFLKSKFKIKLNKMPEDSFMTVGSIIEYIYYQQLNQT